MDLERKLHKKELEVNSLLELTKAINSNIPEDQLYRIFGFTLQSDTEIRKMALYVKERAWVKKSSFGLRDNDPPIIIKSEYDGVSGAMYIPDHTLFHELLPFHYIIPIRHKSNLLAIVLIQLDERPEEKEKNPTVGFVQTMCNTMMVAIENKRLVRQQIQQEAFKKEVEIAQRVQELLLPSEMKKSDQISFHATYLPNRNVGGDYYDVIDLLTGETFFCVADVSGKGMPAALVMASVHASLHALLLGSNQLAQVIKSLNALIFKHNRGEFFVTMFAAVFDPSDNRLRYVNAGHLPPFYRHEGELEVLETGTTVLGAFEALPYVNEGRIDITKSGLLFSFTDGIEEATNRSDEQYGTERIREILNTHLYFDQEQIHQKILNDLERHRENVQLADDITMLSARFL